MLTITRRALCAAAVAFAFVSAAAAQQPPALIRGEIVQANGPLFTLKTREGQTLSLKLADDVRVSALVKASLDDIKQDSFVGIAGMPVGGDIIQAFSIHIFLPAQRGVVPDRSGPWDAKPGSTMTNAYVESSVAGKDGSTLTVKYQGGAKKITVTRDTVIAAVAKGDKSEVKPGAQVVIFGYAKQADGSILAKVMYVGRGVTPAM
jgi:hypothetical protein